MRSHLLAGLLAVLVPACIVGTGEITDGTDETGTNPGGGGGGGGGDGTGNGDGTGGGDNTGGGMQTGTPRIQATADKTTVASELGKTETVTVTVQSMDSFAGTVNITPTLMDGTTALTNFTLTATPSTLDLGAGETATVQVAVKIPTDAGAMAPTLKVDLSSGAVTANVTSAFTVENIYHLTIPAGTGNSSTHAGLPSPNSPLRLKAGAKLVFHNADTTTHVIHGNGGIPHENLSLGAPGTDYMVTMTNDATWYCHSHEGTTQPLRPVVVQ